MLRKWLTTRRQVFESRLPLSRIFIIPTPHGLISMIAAFCLIFIGYAYSNNVILILAFVFISLIALSMFYTNFNLSHLNLKLITPSETFAQENFTLTVYAKNLGRRDLIDIALELELFHLASSKPLKKRFKLGIIPNQKNHQHSPYHFVLNLPQRGTYQLKRFKISTNFPFGFFYSWKYLKTDHEFIAFPQRSGDEALPPADFFSSSDEGEVGNQSGDEFYEHQKYQKNHPLQHIDWKVYAKLKELWVKRYRSPADTRIQFDFNRLPAHGPEEKLSQLSLWIFQAQLNSIPWGIRFHDFSLSPDLDREKYLTTLKFLANYDLSKIS